MPDSHIHQRRPGHLMAINITGAKSSFAAHPEQGSILAVVMLAMTIGLLLLSGLQRQLDSQLKYGVEEQRFWQSFNLALSSLNWGMSLRWQPGENQQCQTLAALTLYACLSVPDASLAEENPRRGDEAPRIGVLRGEGRLDGRDEPLVVYHRVTILVDHTVLQIQPLAGGWLDICPVPEASICVPSR
ncbi:YgdB family protein [Dickeya lacustris]|uniref:YgdB family protein n=1 Tax=Dickeya lacustris TaxID=2259638 RepID=A0ABY8G5K2_9GAMM|nr:YgdB family protein [Dickeya lacustris]WFN55222.1 YgdB family protein [Dickeya lacustris]